MITEIQCSAITINPLSIIDKSYLELIKLTDKHPKFATYVVGQEGISKPKVLETGMAKIINWSKQAIKQISDKIKLGIDCIVGHTKDNTLRSEKIVGKIAGKSIQEINGKLSSVVAVYFPEKDIPSFDVISMESDVEIAEDDSIAEVHEVKRFALGNSSEVSPAFPGAVKMGEVQCFEPVSQNRTVGETRKMNFHEVRQAVKDLNIFPSQLYDLKEMVGNFDQKKGLFYGGLDNKFSEYLNNLPLKNIIEDTTEKDKKLKELEEQNKQFLQERQSLVKEQAVIKLRKHITENNVLDAKQKTYIEKKISKYIPETGEQEELDKFVNEQLEDYKEFIAIHSDKFSTENAKLLPENNIDTRGIPKGYL